MHDVQFVLTPWHVLHFAVSESQSQNPPGLEDGWLRALPLSQVEQPQGGS